MERAAIELAERRVLIVAPVGKDAMLLTREIERSGVSSLPCASVSSLLESAQDGAAMLLIAEEALPPYFGALSEWLGSQPAWSDIPVLLLTGAGAGSPTVVEALRRFGNVSLIERPVRVAALLSTVHSAMRARLRQYQIRAHMQEREAAHRRKDQFLATLAHELRNPLAPIANCVALLRRLPAGTDVTPLCDMLDRQANQLNRLVDDLMDVSRITRGKIALRSERIDLRVVVATAVETVRPQIDAARHVLELDLPPHPLEVEGDDVRLCQVLANLLSNAAKYTDAGGRLRVEAGRENGCVHVAVEDNGIGIAPDALDGVFDLFAQVDAYDVRARGGLGIGLTLARSLVEMHGGSLTACSSGLGEGSRFEVRLPAAPALRPVDEVAAPASAVDLRGRRVLVVDDNRDAADSLAFLLRVRGASLEVAYDGLSGLDAARAFAPDVAILDLGMPGMSGYELARHLRDEGPRPRLLIALSGWGAQQDRLESTAAGFHEHLLKPVDVEELAMRVAACEPAPAPARG
jgi:signal transduction histidine kinase/ActR/RegA family two-component response regulator